MIGEAIAATAGVPVSDLAPVAGGDICRAWRARLADGRTVFAKSFGDRSLRSSSVLAIGTQESFGDRSLRSSSVLAIGTQQSLDSPPDAFFASEAAGLRWLAEANAVPVPEVIGVSADVLVLAWVEAGGPSAAAAERLGRGLAGLHRAGAPSYGAGWPGFAGTLPLDNTPSGSWPDFYARQRLAPYVRAAHDAGRFDAADVAVFDRLAERLPVLAVDEPPARLHGDLWNGNVLWSPAGAHLVDPAAHGGHRETDLAMLALFGAPHLDRILAAYQEQWPLADGWRDRVGLHQLHPLLVHTVLFGGGYGARAVATARRYL